MSNDHFPDDPRYTRVILVVIFYTIFIWTAATQFAQMAKCQ